jgi:hypothetical protein
MRVRERLTRPGFALARVAFAALACAAGVHGASAQDLSPRAYVISPVASNAVNLGYTYNTGELLFEGTVPITDSTGRLHAGMVSYYRSFSLLGRSANVLAALPYGHGTFEGKVLGAERTAPRSGLFDSAYRLSVNLIGAPAMSLAEARQWRQRTLLGASLKVVAPTGQYDPTKLINLGSNRWSFKPELGYSGRFGNFLLDAYASVWFFTENPDFFSRNEYVATTQAQTQDPIGAAELHLSYDVRPRYWVSLDANFWYGGRTSLNGVENPATLQKNSRIGLTASLPLTRRQSVKVGYARGAYIRFGGDYQIFSVGWQYAWIDGVK